MCLLRPELEALEALGAIEALKALDALEAPAKRSRDALRLLSARGELGLALGDVALVVISTRWSVAIVGGLALVVPVLVLAVVDHALFLFILSIVILSIVLGLTTLSALTDAALAAAPCHAPHKASRSRLSRSRHAGLHALAARITEFAHHVLQVVFILQA